MKKIITLLLIINILSCGNDNNRIHKQVESLWNKPEKTIDDFNHIYTLVSKNNEVLDSLVNVNDVITPKGIDKVKLKKLYFNEVIDTTKLDIKVNLFLENSGSMFGYFKGQTDAETTLAKILVHSGYFFGKEDLSFSFITDEVIKQDIKGEVTQFINRLEPKKMRVGNYTNSQVASIIKTVINSTKKNDISILVSDCIYSLKTGSDVTQNVNFEWAIIEEAFLNLLKNSDSSVLINKYISNYNGTYWVLNAKTGKEKGVTVGNDGKFIRPYYVIVIGDTNLLNTAINEIDFSDYPGYQNSYLITSPKSAKRIDYSIINSFKKGSFRPDKKDYKHTLIKARRGTKGNHKNLFQYTIAANLEDIKTEQSYLLDSTKYKVTGDYSLSIKEITEDIIKQDPSLTNYTHLLSLTNNNNLREEEISVSLKRETPQWIEDTHTDIDDILTEEYQYKTRGFKHLVEGIESAFYQAQKRKSDSKTENKYYFTLTTKIKL